MGTTDILYSLTRPDGVDLKLARLWADKTRNTSGGSIGVILAQNYHFGQFVLDSHPDIGDRYSRLVELATPCVLDAQVRIAAQLRAGPTVK